MTEPSAEMRSAVEFESPGSAWRCVAMVEPLLHESAW